MSSREEFPNQINFHLALTPVTLESKPFCVWMGGLRERRTPTYVYRRSETPKSSPETLFSKAFQASFRPRNAPQATSWRRAIGSRTALRSWRRRPCSWPRPRTSHRRRTEGWRRSARTSSTSTPGRTATCSSRSSCRRGRAFERASKKHGTWPLTAWIEAYYAPVDVGEALMFDAFQQHAGIIRECREDRRRAWPFHCFQVDLGRFFDAFHG